MRVVLLCEGEGERGALGLRRPGDPIVDADEAAGHRLVRRVLESIERTDVKFHEPLRKKDAGPAVGSDLHVPRIVKKLCSYVVNPPDLIVLLVDEDHEPSRYQTLQAVPSLIPKVVGVARKEFEAWLLGDVNVVRAVVGDVAEPPHVEDMKPGEAKRRVQEIVGAKRIDVANRIDVDALKSKSKSFERFVSDLRAAVASLSV